MDIAAASTANSLAQVQAEMQVGLLKKSLNLSKDLTSQLFTKVLEGSLDPNLGKSLDIKV
ncbi:YjfB family protein [Paenibacillus endoradicis]|uniref:YjfB family protein n=1 Tax=Paenibacillus endoradicis TaxID=2972487 RepID=UPI0021596704|nr:YjfB family protein [Paenibacillus endoradicis]MCR8657138.1 YjfB family protein [Paenibacillus endoradicis]